MPARALILLAAFAFACLPAAAQTGRWARFSAAAALSDSANAAYQGGRFAEAGPLFVAAADGMFGTDRSGALYNGACAFALAGQTDAATETLDAAVAAGWSKADLMQADADLASRSTGRPRGGASSRAPRPTLRPAPRRRRAWTPCGS